MTPSIVFLSDFGYRNEWVGICHAVIDRIAPGSPIIDLSHGIPPLDVRAGALLLADPVPCYPASVMERTVITAGDTGRL
jgi:S-adenosylmethionine hydrolase